MKIYATFDDDGFPTGFWNDEVFPNRTDGSQHPSIPSTAICITPHQWQEFIDNAGLRKWEDGRVVPFTPAPGPTTVGMIKAECRRRILAVMNEDHQRNSLADALFGSEDYSEEWAEIRRLRSRSNEIEQMDPLPADLKDDALW